MLTPINPKFYDALRDARTYAIDLLKTKGMDFNSETFLGCFPLFILDDYLAEEGIRNDVVIALQERLTSAAFADEFRFRTEEAIELFCSDRGKDTHEAHFLRMIDDFLNYAIPRSAGLPDEAEQFDTLYSRFENDLFSDSYTLNVIAPLENLSDHHGSFRPANGELHFAWANLHPGTSYSTAHLRKRPIRYLELKETPVFGAGAVRDNNGFFFLLEFQETRLRKQGGLAEAYQRAEEIVRKTVLTARLLTVHPVYAQCVGIRLLAHYAGGGRGMILWNPRNEWIEERSGVDLQSCGQWFQKLFPLVLSAPAGSIEILFLKIDDALRRRRKTSRPFRQRDSRADVDRLLDYCQALESILPFRGSQIPESAALLLGADARGLRGAQDDPLNFLKDMYTMRDSVMHGRFDQVVEDRAGTHYTLKDIDRFRRYVYDLAILYFLNPDPKGEPNLRRFITHLRRGKAVALRTLADA